MKGWIVLGVVLAFCTWVGGARAAEIVGTNANDRIVATPENDQVWGLDGWDEIFGLRGDDELRGGRQPDRLVGGPGWDLLLGGRGNDELWGVNPRTGADHGTDYLVCGRGRHDIVYYGSLDVYEGCEGGVPF